MAFADWPAVEKMLATANDLEVADRVRYYRVATETYVKIGDSDGAKGTIEKGLGMAAKIYKNDSDSDNPNVALKAFWPSTNAYCGFLRVAERISPAWATTLLREIPDSEIRVAAEVNITLQSLGLPAGQSYVLTTNKNGSRVTLNDQ